MVEQVKETPKRRGARGAGAAGKKGKAMGETRGLDLRPATKLSRAALAFRVAHAAIALEQLLAISYVWWCALTGRRSPLLRLASGPTDDHRRVFLQELVLFLWIYCMIFIYILW